MKKWMRAALLFVVFLVWPAVGHAAEQGEARISLEYGFQGNVKNGNCFPVRVTIDYTGEQTEAELLMRVPVEAEGGTVGSEVLMGYGSGEIVKQGRIYTYEKKITLDENQPYQETFYLELPVFEGNLQISVERGEKILGQEEIHCNFTENAFRILVGVVSDQPDGIEKLDGMQINMEQGYGMEVFIKTILLKPEEIYPNPEALAQLDVLIADVGIPFDEEQKLALERWHQSGGFYLERKNENLVELFDTLLETETKQRFFDHLEEKQYYSMGDTGYMDMVPVKKRPSMVKYLLLLIVYVILVGPGLYLFLKKKDKRQYLWMGVCILAALFVMIIGIMGRKTNISAPFISYCGLYEQQGTVWSENLKIGIQAPYNNSYTLYLDSDYRLRPMSMGYNGQIQPDEKTAGQIKINMEDSRYKVTVSNMGVFVQNYLELEKNKKIADSEKIQAEIQGNAYEVNGSWKNATPYTIHHVILVMANRAACLGTMEAGQEGNWEKARLYSYGNGGMEYLLKELEDFSDYPYPEYELQNLTNQVWDTLRRNTGYAQVNEAYLLGIVEDPDLSFQQNSGYKVYGSTILRMPVEINWEKDGYRWCPNLELTGQSQNEEFAQRTNLTAQKECTVDYQTLFLGNLEKLRLFSVEYDEEKYYYPFEGNVALYNWQTLSFEEIHDWDEPIEGDELAPYVSENGVVRVRYLLEDTLYRTDSSCMLPCLWGAGKAE